MRREADLIVLRERQTAQRAAAFGLDAGVLWVLAHPSHDDLHCSFASSLHLELHIHRHARQRPARVLLRPCRPHHLCQNHIATGKRIGKGYLRG